ncbi:MAG: glycosyltransferase family 2 protein [Alphaproteobacteria bacterium]|nr:glycosyltransferase family 2 protein [Alphaproteobacteria bacterium]
MTVGALHHSGNRASPTLTLAVIELVGGEALKRSAATLQELAVLYSATSMIICRPGSDFDLDPALFPNVMIVEDGGETIPKRRLGALEKSKSDIICLIEDTMTIPHDWVEGVRAAFDEEQTGAAWGPINLSSELGPRYWALALLEYGRFLRPQTQKGFADNIPGCCMTFRRQVLKTALGPVATGIFEQAVAEQLVRGGGLINHQADLGSIYSVEDEYSAKLSTRMGHGRLYAGQIAQEQTVIQRTYGAMRSVLVPGLFIFRGVRDSFSMNNDGLSFMKLFWLVMLSSAWGVGEIRGYLTGAGDSLGSWR